MPKTFFQNCWKAHAARGSCLSAFDWRQLWACHYRIISSCGKAYALHVLTWVWVSLLCVRHCIKKGGQAFQQAFLPLLTPFRANALCWAVPPDTRAILASSAMTWAPRPSLLPPPLLIPSLLTVNCGLRGESIKARWILIGLSEFLTWGCLLLFCFCACMFKNVGVNRNWGFSLSFRWKWSDSHQTFFLINRFSTLCLLCVQV